MDFANIISCAQKVVDEYGYDAQSRQLIEEMAELTQAINKDWRLYEKFNKTKNAEMYPKLDESHKHIVEEIADVYFCLIQIASAVGAFNVKDGNVGELENALAFKMSRQMERIEKSKKESMMAKIKTADELLEADENDLTFDEKERLIRIKRIPPEVRSLFEACQKNKMEMVMKLEREREEILDYLNGFTDNTDKEAAESE